MLLCPTHIYQKRKINIYNTICTSYIEINESISMIDSMFNDFIRIDVSVDGGSLSFSNSAPHPCRLQAYIFYFDIYILCAFKSICSYKYYEYYLLPHHFLDQNRAIFESFAPVCSAFDHPHVRGIFTCHHPEQIPSSFEIKKQTSNWLVTN